MIKYKNYVLLPDYATNTYLIWDESSKEAIIVDAAAPSQKLVDDIQNLKLHLKYIILTHGHADHIGGIPFVKEHFEVPVLIHKADKEKLTDAQKNLSSYMGEDFVSGKPDVLMKDGDIFHLGKETFKVIHTPGHTQGGICLRFSDFIITGDTLFAGSIGRTDLPGGNSQQLLDSIKNKLFTLSEKLIVLPGHGDSSTIEEEKVGNPFVGLASLL